MCMRFCLLSGGLGTQLCSRRNIHTTTVILELADTRFIEAKTKEIFEECRLFLPVPIFVYIRIFSQMYHISIISHRYTAPHSRRKRRPRPIYIVQNIIIHAYCEVYPSANIGVLEKCQHAISLTCYREVKPIYKSLIRTREVRFYNIFSDIYIGDQEDGP